MHPRAHVEIMMIHWYTQCRKKAKQQTKHFTYKTSGSRSNGIILQKRVYHNIIPSYLMLFATQGAPLWCWLGAYGSNGDGDRNHSDSCLCVFQFIFSVTRRSRSDESHWLTESLSPVSPTVLMWLWWVRIPTRDLTDVTLVSEDTY